MENVDQIREKLIERIINAKSDVKDLMKKYNIPFPEENSLRDPEEIHEVALQKCRARLRECLIDMEQSLKNMKSPDEEQLDLFKYLDKHLNGIESTKGN